MKIFNYKKASFVDEWGPWIFFIIAVGVVGIIIVKLANVNVSSGTNIPEGLEDELVLAARFYNSEDCFAYVDDVGRVHPKVIDVNKFTQENMNKCFPQGEVKYAFSLSLSVPRPRTSGPGPPLVLGPINTFNWWPGFERNVVLEDIFIILDGNKIAGNLKINIKNVK